MDDLEIELTARPQRQAISYKYSLENIFRALKLNKLNKIRSLLTRLI